jgi:hypothetical protein
MVATIAENVAITLGKISDMRTDIDTTKTELEQWLYEYNSRFALLEATDQSIIYGISQASEYAIQLFETEE